MTLFLTVGVRDTNHRDEFHITTFFRVRFAKGVSLLSTLEFLLWSYSNKTFRTKAFFIGITFGGSIWTRGVLFHRLFCYSLYWCSRTALVVVFLYGGNIPFVVSLCFASQRTPTACPCCAGSISTIGLAPFCFKSAGLALVWASAVLLWFLALLYTTKAELSIRRVHNKWDVFLHQKSKKLGYINCTKMFGPFVDDLWKKARNRRRTLMCSENLCYHSRQWMVVAQRSQTKVPSSGFFFCFGAVNVFHNR